MLLLEHGASKWPGSKAQRHHLGIRVGHGAGAGLKNVKERKGTVRFYVWTWIQRTFAGNPHVQGSGGVYMIEFGLVHESCGQVVWRDCLQLKVATCSFFHDKTVGMKRQHGHVKRICLKLGYPQIHWLSIRCISFTTI